MVEKKVLIAETSTEISEQLCEMLEDSYDMSMCHNGISVRELLEKNCPDVLVMDLTLPGLDGLSLLKQIALMSNRPKILVTTCFMSPYVEAAISELGVDMMVMKPCKPEVLVGHIHDMTQEEIGVNTRFQSATTIVAMLMELNVSSKRKGFTYLEQSIREHIQWPVQTLTKGIYINVAKEYSTNGEAVERAIRQSINEAWVNRNDRTWRKYFAPGREGIIPRPTNAEFISRLSEMYRTEQEKQA